MKPHLVALAVATGALIFALPVRAQTQLVTDGGFESQVLPNPKIEGTLKNWAETVNPGDIGLFRNDGNIQTPLANHNVVFMQAGTQIIQTLGRTLQPGTTYTVSFDYYMSVGSPAGKSMNSRIAHGTGAGASSAFVGNIADGDVARGSTHWSAPLSAHAQHFAGSFTTPASISDSSNPLAVILTPRLDLGDQVYVDNVSVEAVPAAAVPSDPEARVEDILGKMTLEEKVAMCLGAGMLSFKGVPRLGIPDMVCTDGPRGPHHGTAFPTGVAFGATWNPALIGRAAEVMGKETRADGATMLLAPGINILRDPLNGRFFEYYTEDPFLNSELAVAFVRGLQSCRVAACIKHFVANNRERNRNFYISMVGQRALREIYFPAFKAGVQRGGSWALMTSANGVNGGFVSDSKFLLTDVLKDSWGFDGMVLTDWLGTRSTDKAALAGLDVSMPFGETSLFRAPLLEAVKAGRVPEDVVTDKARRVLRTMGRVGLLDGIPPAQGGVARNPEHYKVSREVADESLVLLKNAGNLLPLDLAKTKMILVVGPNADQRFNLTALGGSSWQDAAYEITPLQGIKKLAGNDAQVRFFTADELAGFATIPSDALRAPGTKEPGFLAEYTKAGETEPSVRRVEPKLDFLWEMKSPDMEKIPPDGFRARFTGEIIPPVSGTYTLRVKPEGGVAYLFVDPVGGAPIAFAHPGAGIPSATATIQMEAGKPFFLRMEYLKASGDAACLLEWELPTDEQKRAGALANLASAAKEADVVLVFAGLDHSLDSEGRDRTDMKFPEMQEAMIRAVAAANPRTVVTLINGSPLEVGGWIDAVPAVLEAWYPGMEGGAAIADALFGRINPSGKLPFTWPKRLEDSPAHAVGRQDNDRVEYLEGVFVGYRYFDTRTVEPQFPFGHGLSYTTFDYSGLSVKPDGDGVNVRFAVKNTGDRAGAETAQVYVRPPDGPVPRPAHELKGFKKLFLQPGESQEVTLNLDRQAFAYFDEAKDDWVVPPGEYLIEAGGNSRQLPLSQSVKR